VVAKTPVGKAFEDQVAQYSDLLGKAVADSLEGMTLDERNEFENSLVGGGKLITSVLTGAVPGRRVHGDRKTVSVEKSPSEPRPSDRTPCCFAAGTKVSTPAGDRVIESLKVDDIVWTKPERGGKPFAARILATHQRSDQPIYRLKLKSIRGSEAVSSETLLVTPSHPFYVPAQRGFVSVIDLKPGDRLQSLADGNSEDSSSEVESLELYLSVGTTYNLTVDVGHTFYVGEMRTWVHNVGPCDTVPNGGAKGIDKLFEAGRTPKASELKQYAEAQGWKPSQTDGGPLKYVDENGIPRVTIKQGSSRAPGSADPHVEFKDAVGQRTDAFGNPVTRKSPDNHTSIEFDL